LALADADGDARQRRCEPVSPQIEVRGEGAVAGKSPAVDGEDPHWGAGEGGPEPAEYTRLRAVRVHDVGSHPAHQPHDLEQAKQVMPWVNRSTDVSQGDEPRPCGVRRVAQRPGPMRGDDHIEACRNRWQ
jgi:hypothetical protein